MKRFAQISAMLFSIAVILRAFRSLRSRYRNDYEIDLLIENIRDGIVIIDAHSRVLKFNQEAGHILQIHPSSAVGKPLQEVNTHWQSAFDSLLQANPPQQLITHQQAGQTYELYTSPCLVGRLFVIHNITTRCQMEENAHKAQSVAEERANRLEIIKTLAETLNQTLPPERALEAGLAMVAQQVGAQSGWFLTLTPNNKAVLSAGYRLPAHIDLARHRDHHWPLCACLREQRDGRLDDPIRVFNCERLSRSKNLSELTPKHHLSIPVRASGKPVGILNLIVPAEREFDDSEIGMLSLFGDQFGGAIERARLFAEVHKLAITDPLTELYNRRYFFEVAEKEFERARRYGGPLSVAMLDVDTFKHINDQYGHLAGDQVLQTVARLSSSEIRRIDILGRYGGEELIVLMPETSHAQALLAMERLRNAVEAAVVTTPRGSISVTVSIGMSSVTNQHYGSLQQLIDQADQALYIAKQAGRNRVYTFDSDPV